MVDGSYLFFRDLWSNPLEFIVSINKLRIISITCQNLQNSGNDFADFLR